MGEYTAGMAKRRKIDWKFATAAAVVFLLGSYISSFGVVRHYALKYGRRSFPDWLNVSVAVVYDPLIWTHRNSPGWLKQGLETYWFGWERLVNQPS